MKEYFIVSSYNDKEKINNLTTAPTVYESLQAYKDSGKRARKGLYVWKVRTNEQYNSGDKIKESDTHNLRLVGDMSAWQEYSSNNVQPITEPQEQKMVEAAQEQQATQTSSNTKEGYYIHYGRYRDEEPPQYVPDSEEMWETEQKIEQNYEDAVQQIIDDQNDYAKEQIEKGIIPDGDYSVEYEEIEPLDIEWDYDSFRAYAKGVFKHKGKDAGEVQFEADNDTRVTSFGEDDIYWNVLDIEGVEEKTVNESEETDVDFWADEEDDYAKTFFDGGESYEVLETLASDIYIDMNGFTGEAELVSCTPNGKDILYAVLLDGDPDMVDENEDSMRDHFYSIVDNPNYFDDAFMESYGCTKSCLESLRNIHCMPVGTQIVVEGYFVAREGSTKPKRVYKESRNYLKKRVGERIMYKCGDIMLTEQQLNYIVSNLYSTRKLARNSIKEDVKPDGPSNITIRSSVVHENVDATTVGKLNYTAAGLTDAGDTLSSSIEIQNTPQGYTWKDTTYTIDSGAVFDSIQDAAQNAMATVELNYPLYAIEWSELIPIN